MNKTNETSFYIPTKGRQGYMHTSKALTGMGVPHFLIVEEKEIYEYEKSVSEMGLLAEVLCLDHKYKDDYELCDSLGLTKSTGPGPARNFAWDHSASKGNKWHWVMDDNIRDFYRLNNNLKVRCKNGNFWKSMQDFCERYKNVSMAGPNYELFVPRKSKVPPFILNTRIYSCNFIRNDVPFRWRGRYNEDTILSLDMLKDGWCTIQFNAFLQDKMVTQSVKGGNTGEFYHKEGVKVDGKDYAINGTLAKSQMQVAVHPDVSKIVYRFGRIHHHVNYKPFKRNKLIRKKGIKIEQGVNNYGMTLHHKKKRGAICV
jgi:hypothetical protein